MKRTLILWLVLWYVPVFSQGKWDANWVLGYDTHSSTPEGEGILIKFTESAVTVDFLEKDMNMRTDNGTMSDAEGNLLFYTNGCYIANAEHQVMMNGEGINPGNIHQSYCARGYPMIQGVVILPALENPGLYHMIHHRANNGNPYFSDILYRTLIDMSLDNGLGGVVDKNVPVLEDSLWSGYLTAVKHANNTDWWIINARGFSDSYYKILLTPEGFEVVDLQAIGIPSEIGSAGCQATFSPDGTKYVWYDQRRQVQVFDFDRSTGQFSNPQQLFIADTIWFGGVAVSPDSRFLYVSNAIYLYQFDLQAADVQASKVVIDTFDGFSSPFPANFFLMQLGPDCRIYMSTGNGADRLHVIHHPNRKGKACGFKQHAVLLPQSNASTIPNNPNYRLGTPYPVCDSTIQLVTGSVAVLPPAGEVAVYPNPATGSVSVELSLPLAGGGEWWLHTAAGQAVRQVWLPPGETLQAVPLSGLAPGLYFWSLRSGEGRLVGRGKLVVGR